MACLAKTPQRIGEDIFSIPIYQRLFTWAEEEVKTLLNDLSSQFNENPNDHYYIGLLTATDKKELVDGQQRFTIIMLFAILMRDHYPMWNNFLRVNGETRLRFKARPNDAEYLAQLISGNVENEKNNKYMANAIKVIGEFLSQHEKPEEFCKYVYEHMAFFIQELPKGYSGKMLNKYFESMNSTGRNLENHEILKVNMIEKAKVEEDAEEYDRLISLWNQASRMNQTVFPVYEEKRNDYRKYIGQITSGDFICDFKDESEHSRSIINVLNEGVNYAYVNNTRKSTFHSFLKFTDFLLLVLYMTLEDKKVLIPNKSKFFKPENLRKTFKEYETYFEPKQFFEDLFVYRIILDWAIIRVDDSYDYDLALTDSENSKLQQYEAMLYANSSRDTYYQWIPAVLRFVKKYGDNEDDILREIKRMDDIDNPFVIKENNIERPYSISDFKYRNYKYFYRRLDYYLWEKIVHENTYDGLIDRELTPNEWKELKAAVSSFKFHSYNSEEHLYPQHDDKQYISNRWITDGKRDDESINAFGNLALISSSFNSSQNDDALDRKFGSIRNHIMQKRIESIKLALMYYSAHGMAENWTAGENGVSTRHGKIMFDFLRNTYNKTE